MASLALTHRMVLTSPIRGLPVMTRHLVLVAKRDVPCEHMTATWETCATSPYPCSHFTTTYDTCAGEPETTQECSDDD